MIHKISISTVEALVINKALRLADMQNDTDELMASMLIDRINIVVGKDLERQKPTDLTHKCGSCKWAKPRDKYKNLKSYIDCKCPDKKPNFFARTTPKCRFYEKQI